MRIPLIDRIFHYDDYRQFLDDFFQANKQLRQSFSHRFFARKAGFSSSSFCLSVIKGRFNLSEEAARKIVQAMELDSREARFFQALVQYNQSKRKEERDQAWGEVQRIRKTAAFQSLASPQHRYFSHWYYPVLCELAPQLPAGADSQHFARMLEPSISTEEARVALQDLLDWGLLERMANGRLRRTEQLLNSQGVPPLHLRSIRREFLEHGISALDQMPSSQRYFTFSTLGMGADSYAYCVQILEEARQRILARVAADESVEKVCELVVQLFPLSKTLPPQESL